MRNQHAESPDRESWELSDLSGSGSTGSEPGRRVVYADAGLTVTLLLLPAGSESTRRVHTEPGSLHVLEGEASITLGDETIHVCEHTWIRMPPGLPHRITARTDVRVLVSLHRGGVP